MLMLTLVHDRERSAAPSKGAEVRFASEAALIAAAAKRHPEAARVMWDRYAVMVRRLILRTVGPSEVDDLVQESFLRLFDCIERLRDAERLRSFVAGVTMRVAREELRRRKARRWLRLSDDGELSPPPSRRGGDIEAYEALNRLYALLDRLDADTRMVFVLRFVEEMPASEVAEVLEVSLATAKRRIRRAQAKVLTAARNDPSLASYLGAEEASS